MVDAGIFIIGYPRWMLRYTLGMESRRDEIYRRWWILSSNMKYPFSNVSWHSGAWPYAVTHSIYQILHQLITFSLNWTLLIRLPFLTKFREISREYLQWMWHINKGLSFRRIPGPRCSSFETCLFGTCHVSGIWISNINRHTSIILSTALCHFLNWQLNYNPVSITPFKKKSHIVGVSFQWNGGWFVPFRLFIISLRHNEGVITQ